MKNLTDYINESAVPVPQQLAQLLAEYIPEENQKSTKDSDFDEFEDGKFTLQNVPADAKVGHSIFEDRTKIHALMHTSSSKTYERMEFSDKYAKAKWQYFLQMNYDKEELIGIDMDADTKSAYLDAIKK